MYKVHAYLDNVLLRKEIWPALPHTGETVMIAEGKFAKVTEIIWCLDEEWCDIGYAERKAVRVNVRLETEK